MVGNPKTASSWNKHSNVMVSLNAEDQPHLYQIAKQLEFHNIPFTLFYEPDIDQHTAICTTDKAAHLFNKLPLALKNHGPFRPNGKVPVSKTVDTGSTPVRAANNKKVIA